jgi:hypothetical protein
MLRPVYNRTDNVCRIVSWNGVPIYRLILFTVYGLINNAVSISDYTESKDTVISE